MQKLHAKCLVKKIGLLLATVQLHPLLGSRCRTTHTHRAHTCAAVAQCSCVSQRERADTCQYSNHLADMHVQKKKQKKTYSCTAHTGMQLFLMTIITEITQFLCMCIWVQVCKYAFTGQCVKYVLWPNGSWQGEGWAVVVLTSVLYNCHSEPGFTTIE